MSDLKWDDSYSVGITKIDDDHQNLIKLINEAHGAVFGTDDAGKVAAVVKDMKEYALNHLGTEEKLMDQYDYPDADEHKSQHEIFRMKSQMLNSLVSGGDGAPDPLDVFQFLSLWLIDHIMKHDKKFGDFLSEQGES